METTTLQMAGAYSAFGNNGYYTKPHAVKEIELRDGTKINMKPKTEAAMNDYTAFMISDMLKSVVNSSYGTGKVANVPGLPVAGKTGTTNYSSEELRKYGHPRGAVPDAWFAGYTTNYTAAIWTGYEYRKDAIRATRDQQIAMKIFRNLIQHVSKDVETADFPCQKRLQRSKLKKARISWQALIHLKISLVMNGRLKEMHQVPFLKSTPRRRAWADYLPVYDQSTNEITLSWKFNGEEPNVQFLVTVSKDGGAEQTLTTTSQKGLRMPVIEPGAIIPLRWLP